MAPTVLQLTGHVRNKRCSFGGAETHHSVVNHPSIMGNGNNVNVGMDPSKIEPPQTLIRKVGHEVGRVLEGGADLVTSPVKWIKHMQENWLKYLVCITVILIVVLIFYCCIRRKVSTFLSASGMNGTSKLLNKLSTEEPIIKKLSGLPEVDGWNRLPATQV